MLTRDGIKKIGTLSGKTISVMTEYGRWVDAEIRSFGEQKLYRVELNKGKAIKLVYATAGHRWFKNGRDKKIEVITFDLTPEIG
jgi:hypothetical protein